MVETYPILATVSAPAHRHLGSDISQPQWHNIKMTMLDFILEHNVQTHVSMLTPGFDQLVSSLITNLGLDTIVIRPFPNHARFWPPREQEFANLDTDCAKQVITISNETDYKSVAKAYRKIVEISDVLVAVDAFNSTIVDIAVKQAKQDDKTIYIANNVNIFDGILERI